MVLTRIWVPTYASSVFWHCITKFEISDYTSTLSRAFKSFHASQRAWTTSWRNVIESPHQRKETTRVSFLRDVPCVWARSRSQHPHVTLKSLAIPVITYYPRHLSIGCYGFLRGFVGNNTLTLNHINAAKPTNVDNFRNGYRPHQCISSFEPTTVASR